MKEKAHVGFWRRGINKTVATSTFPLTVPIILDHPVHQHHIPEKNSFFEQNSSLQGKIMVT